MSSEKKVTRHSIAKKTIQSEGLSPSEFDNTQIDKKPVVISVFRCSICNEAKLLDDFYKRTSTRRDPVCIECRRKERKDKYQAKKKTTPSKRIIEPKIIQKKYLGANNETSALVQKCDFNDMEKVYGKMTITQKHEAIQRLNDFITLLREGYGEMLGCEVYVRKD